MSKGLNYTPQYKFSPNGFNPLFWHILAALRDSSIRHIFVEGGGGAAKTYSICQAILIDGFVNEYSTLVFRRQLVDVRDSIYAAFKKSSRGLELDYYDYQQHLFKGKDDKSNIRFRGLDDEESIKGIEDFNVVYFNEFNQFEETLHDQANIRLRGKENQKLVYDWNPVSSKLWQYTNLIDQDAWEELPLHIEGRAGSELNKEYSFKRINKAKDTIWIKTTYRDNHWIVGRPSGGGYVDVHTLANFENMREKKPNLYRIYANGERGIIRTGGGFWKSFDEDRHIGNVRVNIKNTIHISCDQNVVPYVTLSFWQIEGKHLMQVHELPCKEPHNNAPKSAKQTVKWLDSIGYEDVVYVYGDPSGNNRSVVDENSSSFFDRYLRELRDAGYHVVNRVQPSHPSVSLSAAFINEIYESEYLGYRITISDRCITSTDDYANAKEDDDGKMLKTKIKDKVTGQTYEPVGHFSDTKRYFITSILKTDFKQFASKKSKLWIS